MSSLPTPSRLLSLRERSRLPSNGDDVDNLEPSGSASPRRSLSNSSRGPERTPRSLARVASASSALSLVSNPNLSLLDSELQVVEDCKEFPVIIVVVGASGDLAHKKTLPALFSLYYHNMLPYCFAVVGYARSKLSTEAFRDVVVSNLVCRTVDRDHCEPKMNSFLERCFYFSGQYDSLQDWQTFDRWLSEDIEVRLRSSTYEGRCSQRASGRLFYLAIPPSVFADTLRGIRHGAMAREQLGAWTRVIVEKPFGRDTESYMALRDVVAECFPEEAIYRIDHYVGKPLVANLTTLRLGNFVFDALWNRHCIESVQVVFKEDFGAEGRAGYFDAYGIIRDILQNHLLQVMSIIAMDPPASPLAGDINEAKLRLLYDMKPLHAKDFIVGQYDRYRSERGVPKDSCTPTFAACVVQIDNERWRGVPFVMLAGKALDERKVYVKVAFRETSNQSFVPEELRNKRNTFYIEIQPRPAVELSFITKTPDLEGRVVQTKLDLVYNESFVVEAQDMPDAYERLISDSIVGDRTLFISDAQISRAWELFDPALKELERDPPTQPVIYPYGSKGPILPETLIKKYMAGKMGD
ncbi:glucose-6-phosphate 1-dehydrogenase [Cyanidiococcus yangmingshanensis]|uniref:Glucose-6-phosphate 1-dehydrogenase n=1 Tax=Cyanidiococcus yangmingshanensis TaxID=2690220 RepID=A0A7J7IHQ7_9RHOD|nr:glucose-6-phosphate 1-dehydrogenase [Cyanidiococcus yangmingshanensis]